MDTLVWQYPECQEDQPGPPPSPLQPWQWPSQSWSRLHITRLCRTVFGAHGFDCDRCALKMNWGVSQWELLPRILLFSNWESCFTVWDSRDCGVELGDNALWVLGSRSFWVIMGSNIWSLLPITQPVTDSRREPCRRGTKKMKAGSVTDRVARVLFNYRITPQAPIGLSPARSNFLVRCQGLLLYLVVFFVLLLVSSPFVQQLLELFTNLGALHLYVVSTSLLP